MKEIGTSGKAVVGVPVAIAVGLALLTSLATGWNMYADSAASEDEAIHAAQLGVVKAATILLKKKVVPSEAIVAKVGSDWSYRVTFSAPQAGRVEVRSIGRAGYHVRGIRAAFQIDPRTQPSAKLITDTWREFEPEA